MSAILPVPHYRQSKEGYCLPACARMVLAYLGIERTEAEISQLLGTRGIGTPGFAIQRLTAWGVQVDASRSSVRNARHFYPVCEPARYASICGGILRLCACLTELREDRKRGDVQ